MVAKGIYVRPKSLASMPSIKKLKSAPLPEGWHVKLEQFEQEMMV